MMYRNNKGLVLTIVCLCAFALLAASQWLYFKHEEDNKPVNGRDEFLKLVKHYKAIENKVAVNGNIRLYDGNEEKESATFSYFKDGSHLYTQLASVETIIDENKALHIDNAEKTISLFGAEEINKDRANSPELFLASLLNDTANLKTDVILQEGLEQNTLIIKSQLTPEIRQYSIEYDPSTYKVASIVVEWWKDVLKQDAPENVWLTKIEYADNKVDKERKRGIKTIRDVIEENGGEVTLKAPYRTYQLYKNY